MGRLKGGLRQALLNLTTRLKNRHISALIILLQQSIVEWYYWIFFCEQIWEITHSSEKNPKHHWVSHLWGLQVFVPWSVWEPQVLIYSSSGAQDRHSGRKSQGSRISDANKRFATSWFLPVRESVKNKKRQLKFLLKTKSRGQHVVQLFRVYLHIPGA